MLIGSYRPAAVSVPKFRCGLTVINFVFRWGQMRTFAWDPDRFTAIAGEVRRQSRYYSYITVIIQNISLCNLDFLDSIRDCIRLFIIVTLYTYNLQELHLCVDGKVWKWSEPFDINTVGSVVRVMKTFNQQQSLIITIKQITNVQKQVAMKLAKET